MNLQSFPFYKKLEAPALEILKEKLKPIKIPQGNILFYQGDICDNILFLTSGKVRLYIHSDNAEEITLYQICAGEQCIVNTASTISQTEAIGSAITLTDIEGYLIDVKSVKELAHISNAYQSFMFSLYSIRMGDLARLINDIKFKNLDERILIWLQAQNSNPIVITHEKLANELGTTRVVVSRVLKELEKNAKLFLTRGAIELLM